MVMTMMMIPLRLECWLSESLLRLEVRLLSKNNSLLGLSKTLLRLESWLSETSLLRLECRLSKPLLRLLRLESRLLLLWLESRLAKSLLWLESWLSEPLWLRRLESWLSSKSLLWSWLECWLSFESLLRLESRLSKSLLLLGLLETLEGNRDAWGTESESRLLRLSKGRSESAHC